MWLAAVGCGDNRVPAIAELVPATDLDPDPSVVEVSLVAAEGMADYGRGTTMVMGYRDGAIVGSPVRVPGPLIEAKLGDRLIVRFENQLAQATTIHWHGLRLPIAMDGDPSVNGAVLPGETFVYDFVLRDAGLHWYHPHVETDMQIEMGLQGPLIVRGPDEPALRERVFVLDDVELDDDGEIAIAATHDDLVLGRRGETVLVNGAPPGTIESARGSVERWRIVNTSNGRFFDLGVDAPMRVIGWDGGLLPEPYDVDRLLVGPGERYDVAIVIDDDRVLASTDYARAHGGVDEGTELVRVRVTDEAPSGVLPERGPPIAPLPAPSATRRFVFTEQLDNPAGPSFFINDQRWPLNTPVPVKLGDVELWEIVNDADGDHPVHVHGHFFQLLDGERLGWKDTVVLPPQTTVRAVIRYEEAGKWMFHCQIPEHAERGMTADVDVRP